MAIEDLPPIYLPKTAQAEIGGPGLPGVHDNDVKVRFNQKAHVTSGVTAYGIQPPIRALNVELLDQRSGDFIPSLATMLASGGNHHRKTLRSQHGCLLLDGVTQAAVEWRVGGRG
jgi:hypothetical protein